MASGGQCFMHGMYTTCRYLKALTTLSEVINNSVGAFSAIAMLLVIFMMVFAIIGLQVFGQAELDIDFPNFHSFFNSLVLVFQVRQSYFLGQ